MTFPPLGTKRRSYSSSPTVKNLDASQIGGLLRNFAISALASSLFLSSLSGQGAEQVRLEDMSNQLLMSRIEQQGIGSSMELVLELLKRLENEDSLDPSLETVMAQIYSELSRYHYNRFAETGKSCLLYTSPSPRDGATSRMPSSA